MKRWLKIAIVVLAVLTPVTAYAAYEHFSQPSCPVTDDCPCAH